MYVQKQSWHTLPCVSCDFFDFYFFHEILFKEYMQHARGNPLKTKVEQSQHELETTPIWNKITSKYAADIRRTVERMWRKFCSVNAILRHVDSKWWNVWVKNYNQTSGKLIVKFIVGQINLGLSGTYTSMILWVSTALDILLNSKMKKQLYLLMVWQEGDVTRHDCNMNNSRCMKLSDS